MTMIKLVAPTGVVIQAPADGWTVCECDAATDDSDLCDRCREAFADIDNNQDFGEWPEQT